MDEAGFIPGTASYDPMLAGTQTQVDPFRRQYMLPYTGVAKFNGTPAIAAIMQMLDPMGLSPDQLDRRQATYGELYKHLIRTYPEAARAGFDNASAARGGLRTAEQNSFGDDLNSVMIKYDHWKKQQTGQDLNPQERIRQGFIDQRNPNSWY